MQLCPIIIIERLLVSRSYNYNVDSYVSCVVACYSPALQLESLVLPDRNYFSDDGLKVVSGLWVM